MTYRRRELDREMRKVLAQLETCSHVPAAGWGPTGQSPSSDEHPGGRRPPGDLGHAYFAQRYGPPFAEATWAHAGAKSDDEREAILAEARDELAHIRDPAARDRPIGESVDDLRARIVREGVGWTVREVAQRMRCGERLVREARKAAGRDPDYGRIPEPEADAEARRQRARELHSTGHTLAQIARLLDVSRSTIERDLGKRAA